MPNNFGTSLPPIDDHLTAKIMSFFDSRSMVLNAPRVSKQWHKILNSEELKEAKALCQFRLTIDKKIFRRSAQFFQETPDSVGLKYLSGGWTNETFILTQRTHKYVTRLPGKNTNLLIDRKHESYNAKIASSVGVNPPIIFSDNNDGTQVTEFIPNPITMQPADFKDIHHLQQAMQSLRTIHRSPILFSNTIDIFKRNEFMHAWLLSQKISLSDQYHLALEKMRGLSHLFSTLTIKKVPCHNDTTPANFIYSKNKKYFMYIIDWEYSGNNDPMWDLAYFARETQLTPNLEHHMLASYFNGQINKEDYLRFCLYKPMVELWIALWTQIQIKNGNHVAGLDTLIQYEKQRIQLCIQLFNSTEYQDTFKQLQAQSNKTSLCCRIL